jgi:hypothetical protein
MRPPPADAQHGPAGAVARKPVILDDATPRKTTVRYRLRIWQLTGAILWVLGLSAIIVSAIDLPRTMSEIRGTLGYVPQGSSFGAKAAHRIVGFDAGSPLPAAGVSIGDLIVAPPRGWLAEGERVTLQVAHDGQTRTVEVRAARESAQSGFDFALLLEGAIAVLALILGTLLLLRRWRDETALALACCMLTGAAALPPILSPVGPLAISVILWTSSALTLVLILLAWVALLMAPHGGRVHQWIARACHGLTVALLAWACTAGWYFFGNAVPAAHLLVGDGRVAIQALAFVLCVVAYVSAWRRVEAEQRERLRWLFVGLACGVVSLGMTVGLLALNLSVGHTSFVVVTLLSDVIAAVAFVILAYAILGQRVIDVGFAINRAIVYAVLTGIMLLGFGVVEWLVDHVLEFEERKKSVLLDGALALGVFLVFHRIQHWVSHTVEHVFFRSWHVRAEALDRFLEMSEHFTDPDVLGKAALEALDTYTESVGSSLYGRDAQGRFVLMRSTLPDAAATWGPNDLAVLRLNASLGKPVVIDVLDVASEHHAETWFFPLARRGKLVGFVMLREKRNRDVYRPDQIERVARAVRQVGFDLYALRLEQAATRAVAKGAPGQQRAG